MSQLKDYELSKNTLIIDPWRIHKTRFALDKNYIPLGIYNEF